MFIGECKMTDKFIIKPKFTIVNSDLNHVGEKLGYDWNTICDLLQQNGLNGEDGSGYFSISKGTAEANKYPEEICNIFNKIFDDNPECKTLYVMDDF